jgi:hypothetical protein
LILRPREPIKSMRQHFSNFPIFTPMLPWYPYPELIAPNQTYPHLSTVLAVPLAALALPQPASCHAALQSPLYLPSRSAAVRRLAHNLPGDDLANSPLCISPPRPGPAPLAAVAYGPPRRSAISVRERGHHKLTAGLPQDSSTSSNLT